MKRALQWILARLTPPQRRQVAALCWRRGDEGVEVLLITTRRTGRWTPPKGNIDDGQTPLEAAEKEAWEEAGAIGQIAAQPIGEYAYMKWRKDERWEQLAVDVFALEVTEMDPDFPERDERRQIWTGPSVAAALVREKGLKRAISSLSG